MVELCSQLGLSRCLSATLIFDILKCVGPVKIGRQPMSLGDTREKTFRVATYQQTLE
jgi:hypothetical protein